jgi:hypothetical protein
MATNTPPHVTALHTYLNDHLAGAVVALQLVDRLIEAPGTPSEAAFLAELRAEIEEDRATLERLLQQLGGTLSGLRQLGGWIAEKVTRLKLVVDDPTGGAAERMQALEILAIGIHGKQLLWSTLAAIKLPDPHGIDLQRLERRAAEQHARVEARRLEAARRALSPG